MYDKDGRRSRVHFEADSEAALSDKLGDQIAQQAFVGVFAGGKKIVATRQTELNGETVLLMGFDDGTALIIKGNFQVLFHNNALSSESTTEIVESAEPIQIEQADG